MLAYIYAVLYVFATKACAPAIGITKYVYMYSKSTGSVLSWVSLHLGSFIIRPEEGMELLAIGDAG